MRTTVDIPEPLLRQARAQAALQGRTLKDVVNEALVQWLNPGAGHLKEPPAGPVIGTRTSGRFTLPCIRSAKPGVAKVTPEMLKEAEAVEDEDRYGALFGR